MAKLALPHISAMCFCLLVIVAVVFYHFGQSKCHVKEHQSSCSSGCLETKWCKSYNLAFNKNGGKPNFQDNTWYCPVLADGRPNQQRLPIKGLREDQSKEAMNLCKSIDTACCDVVGNKQSKNTCAPSAAANAQLSRYPLYKRYADDNADWHRKMALDLWSTGGYDTGKNHYGTYSTGACKKGNDLVSDEYTTKGWGKEKNRFITCNTSPKLYYVPLKKNAPHMKQSEKVALCREATGCQGGDY